MELTKTMRALVFVLATCLTLPAGAGLYKWVDEQGNIQYSDRVPPEQVERARSEMDKRGLTVKRTEAARTPEEIAKEQELARLRAERERLEAEQKAADQVLLRTFRSEDDILMARDGKVQAIDTQIGVTRSLVAQTQERLAEQQRIAADMERQGTPVPPKQVQAITDLRRQVDDSYAAIVQNEQGRAQVIEKYDRDLVRFRQLQSPGQAEAVVPKAKERVSLLETVVPCGDEAACIQMWKKGEAYLRLNAVTPMRLPGANILSTTPPQKDDEFSLTLSRLPDKDDSGTRLFLDLQCRDSAAGREFCNGPQARKVREGFKAALLAP
jgi:hypothetical protein